MYAEALILGLLIGFLRRGKIGNFLSYPFKYRYFALFALFVFVLPYLLQILKVPVAYEIFPFASMILIALVVVGNHKVFGMKILFFGLVLNLLIMAMNGLKMPIDTERLALMGDAGARFVKSMMEGDILNYRTLTGAAGLSQILGKVIALPSWYPLARILSAGDILSSLGIVLAVQESMMINRKGGMLQFTFRPGSR